jgi:putative SOS response-associated peptidase YedK
MPQQVCLTQFYLTRSEIQQWAPEKRLKFSTFNAKKERLMESKIYKPAVPNQRCIIPVTYFFEPDRAHYPKPKPAPWYLFKQKDEEMFGLAGLYNIWTDPKTKEELYTYTIITTEPNEDVGKYHDREPAIMPRNQEKE